MARYKDDGIPYEVNSPFCNISTTILVRQSKSPEDREIGRRFAPLWGVLVPKLQDIFPDGNAKGNFIVPSLDVRAQILSIYDRRNGVGENRFSYQHHPDTKSCVISLLLICANPVFLMLCNCKLFVKPALLLRIARPMCDGRPFASSPFRHLASRGLLFLCSFPLRWPFQNAIFLGTSLSPCNQVSYCEGIVETQCSCPYDTLSCYFHTVLWLGKCQSILTQTQHSSESDMASYRIFHVDSLTCSEVGPMSLEWQLAPQGGLVQSHHSMPQEDANGERPENAHVALPHLRWRRDALQPPEVQRDRLNGDTCAHIPDGGLRCVTWNTRGLIGSPASPQLSREKKHIYLTRLCQE